MSTVISKIKLYKVRTAGEVIGDTFAFLSNNFATLFKNVSCLMLPVCLLLAFAFSLYMDASSSINSFIGSNGSYDLSQVTRLVGRMSFYILMLIISQWVLGSLIFAMIKYDDQNEQGLHGVRLSALMPLFKKNIKRMLVLIGVSILLAVVFGGLTVALALVIGLWSILLLLVITLILTGPLVLLTPVYLLEENISVWSAIKKALQLGMNTWGKIVGVIIVMTVICIIVQGIFTLPWCILYLAKTLMAMDGGTEDLFVNSLSYSILTYLSAVLVSFSYVMIYMVYYVCEAYLYGHAVEKNNE